MWRNLTVAGLWAMAALPAQQATEAELNELAGHIDKALGLRPGMIVADIGTGLAVQHPMRIAREIAPGGKVVCVEISQSAVDKIKKQIDEAHVTNMFVELAKEDDPLLASESFDSILISNAYHEFTRPETMLKHLCDALKPGGTLVVVENYKVVPRSETRAVQTQRHDLAPDILERELAAAGFRVKERVDPVLVNSPDRVRYLVRAEKKGTSPP